MPAVPLVRLVNSDTTAVCRNKLGEGGQGAVYRVQLEDGSSLALKWYEPRPTSTSADRALAQRQTLQFLVSRPAPSRHFLWPVDLAVPALVAGTATHEPNVDHGFGYVMPLRPEGHLLLSALYRDRGPAHVTLRTLCSIGIELADAFLRLHSHGLCYRDISPNNVFFEPTSGDVLVCDNDNVGIDGVSTTSVRGTRMFMAPEIVRREAEPSAATDRHSLAVLLFYVFMAGHPLIGRRRRAFPCHNAVAESELLGRSPLFVFDPDDDSNAPQSGWDDSVLTNWDFFPESTRKLFEQAFTVGLHDPANGRVVESMWRSELTRIRDLVATCEQCGANWFFEPKGPASCWNCAHEFVPPLRLEIGTTTVVLDAATVVTGHHLRHDYDFEDIVLRVVADERDRRRWGLRNESGRRLSATLPDGSGVEVAPGRVLGLLPGVSFDLGSATAMLVHH